jgi:hypothetical protein
VEGCQSDLLTASVTRADTRCDRHRLVTGRATESPPAEDALLTLPVEGSVAAGGGNAERSRDPLRPRRRGVFFVWFGARLLSSPSCDGRAGTTAGQPP